MSLQQMEQELINRKVTNIHFCFHPGILGFPKSDVIKCAEDFLVAYLNGNYTVRELMED